jgi:hypothetical protein
VWHWCHLSSSSSGLSVWDPIFLSLWEVSLGSWPLACVVHGISAMSAALSLATSGSVAAIHGSESLLCNTFSHFGDRVVSPCGSYECVVLSGLFACASASPLRFSSWHSLVSASTIGSLLPMCAFTYDAVAVLLTPWVAFDFSCLGLVTVWSSLTAMALIPCWEV